MRWMQWWERNGVSGGWARLGGSDTGVWGRDRCRWNGWSLVG